MQVIERGVKGVIVSGTRFLALVKPNGEWDLPGGRIEPEETTQDALCREVLEETGLKVKGLKLCCLWSFVKRPGLFIQGSTWLCNCEFGEPILSPEHRRHLWVELERIDCLDWKRSYLGLVPQAGRQSRFYH